MRISDWSSDVCSSDLSPACEKPGLASSFYAPRTVRSAAPKEPCRERSIDVDLREGGPRVRAGRGSLPLHRRRSTLSRLRLRHRGDRARPQPPASGPGDPGAGRETVACLQPVQVARAGETGQPAGRQFLRSEEHTSELQSLMRISYA